MTKESKRRNMEHKIEMRIKDSTTRGLILQGRQKSKKKCNSSVSSKRWKIPWASITVSKWKKIKIRIKRKPKLGSKRASIRNITNMTKRVRLQNRRNRRGKVGPVRIALVRRVLWDLSRTLCLMTRIRMIRRPDQTHRFHRLTRMILLLIPKMALRTKNQTVIIRLIGMTNKFRGLNWSTKRVKITALPKLQGWSRWNFRNWARTITQAPHSADHKIPCKSLTRKNNFRESLALWRLNLKRTSMT